LAQILLDAGADVNAPDGPAYNAMLDAARQLDLIGSFQIPIQVAAHRDISDLKSQSKKNI
jgi:hypothetical protein